MITSFDLLKMKLTNAYNLRSVGVGVDAKNLILGISAADRSPKDMENPQVGANA